MNKSIMQVMKESMQDMQELFGKKEKPAFKVEWAKTVNDKGNKPYKDKTYGNKIRGNIYGVHFVVYNIVRDLPIDRGFIKGSEALKAHLRYIEWVLRVLRCPAYINTRLLFPFGENINVDSFKEKADEALRLYSCS